MQPPATATAARAGNRAPGQMRPVLLEPEPSRYAEGSCLAHFGATRVFCTATVENRVPPFLHKTGRGWVTAEYGMLPRSTHSRMDRAKTASGGRTQEISRLIGRSLRAVTRLDAFGERQIRVDCDVLQADGGTRTAAITGGFVALALAFRHLKRLGVVTESPLTGAVAAVSCALTPSGALLDPDYAEDSAALADANFVLAAGGDIIEIQATAERAPFAQDRLLEMLALARQGVTELLAAQQQALAAAETAGAAAE